MRSTKAQWRDASRLFQQGHPTDRKRLLRAWVEGVTLAPEKLEGEITYRVPNSVMNSLVAGARNERKVTTLPYRLRVSDAAA